ncbi:hypothetical protein OS21_38370 [Dickeya oryzae]
MSDSPQIIDMCCGSRMFWFDKGDQRAVFCDIRNEQHTLCDGRHLIISPDVIADFRALPFADDHFSVVVFDPPHLERVGPNGWQGKKYGKLNRDTWRDDLRAGFAEGFRVLRQGGGYSFSNGAKPKSQSARCWRLRTKNRLSGSAPEKTTKPTGLYLLKG